MQYALLIYENEGVYGPDKQGPAMTAIRAKHMAFVEELGATRIAGAGLKNTAAATTVRSSAGKKTVHDGPWAETKEQLGGFYVVEAADLDAAIALAKRVPLQPDGAIEIRPLLGQGPG